MIDIPLMLTIMLGVFLGVALRDIVSRCLPNSGNHRSGSRAVSMKASGSAQSV